MPDEQPDPVPDQGGEAPVYTAPPVARPTVPDLMPRRGEPEVEDGDQWA